MTDRDRFLTEKMGECWHEFEAVLPWDETESKGYRCFKCKADFFDEEEPLNFSTWQDFGKLWQWAKEQEWWEAFLYKEYAKNGVRDKETLPIWKLKVYVDVLLDFIQPDKFSDALYEYLKEEKNESY